MANIDFKLKCWYKDGCNAANYNCEKTCHRYLEMNYLINNCGMKNAERFLKLLQPDERDVDAFLRLNDIKTNVVNFVQTSQNLFLNSILLQTGKTTWALKILYKFFDEIWAGNGFRVRGYFLYVPEFLEKAKTFEYKQSNEFKQLDNILKNADLVIWDDISSCALSPVDQNLLNIYIDKRMIDGKSNIYTGLYQTPEVLKDLLGVKLSARLNACEQIKLLDGTPIEEVEEA